LRSPVWGVASVGAGIMQKYGDASVQIYGVRNRVKFRVSITLKVRVSVRILVKIKIRVRVQEPVQRIRGFLK